MNVKIAAWPPYEETEQNGHKAHWKKPYFFLLQMTYKEYDRSFISINILFKVIDF